MNPEQLKNALDAIEAGDSAAALEILKAMIASAASGGAEPAPETEAAAEVAEPPPADADETAASVAASKQIFDVLGAKTAGEATAALSALVERVKSLDADRAALDLSERQGLVTQLVTAGVETPATAWAEVAKRLPKKRLMDEPIAELRERVKLVAASAKSRGVAPPAGTPEGAPPAEKRPLKRNEIAACKRLGLTEDEFRDRKSNAVRRVK